MPKILPPDKQAIVLQRASSFFTEDSSRVAELPRALVLMGLPEFVQIQRSEVPFPGGVWGRLLPGVPPILILPREASPATMKFVFLRGIAHALLGHIGGVGPGEFDLLASALRGDSTKAWDVEVNQKYALWCAIEPTAIEIFAYPSQSTLGHSSVNEGRTKQALKKALAQRSSPNLPSGAPLGILEKDVWLEVVGGETSPRLELVFAAFGSLPGDVGRVKVTWAEGQAEVLGANLRQGLTRLPVPPSKTPYKLSSIDGPSLALPGAEGFSSSRATVFRVRADGDAERTEGVVVPRGVAVRLLVPPGLGEGMLPAGAPSLAAGWRLLSLTLPAAIQEGLTAQLASLGLEAAPRPLEVGFAGAPPARWRRDTRGQPWPSFRSDTPPALRIEAPGPTTAFQVVLVGADIEATLHGSTRTEGVAVALEHLLPGDYAVEVCLLVEGLRERVFFSIDDTPVLLPESHARVVLGAEEKTLGEAEAIFDADLTLFSEAKVCVKCPPYWEFGVFWRTISNQFLGVAQASHLGEVTPAALAAIVGERCSKSPVADLVLDGKELGRVRFRHERKVDAQQVLERLKLLLDERRQVLPLLSGDCGLLLSVLLVPMAEALAHTCSAPVSWDGGAAIGLSGYTREGDRIVEAAPAVLVALAKGLVVEGAPSPGELRAWRNQLETSRAKRALLSTGLRWFVLDATRKLTPPVIDLSPVLEGDLRPLERLVEVAHA